MKKNLAIYGAGGFGRETLQAILRLEGADIDIAFVDDSQKKRQVSVDGYPVLSLEQALSQRRSFCVAIADGEIRKRIFGQLHSSNATLFDFIAQTAIISKLAVIDIGAIICEHVTLTSNCRIGKFFLANIYSYVAHDCVIGDYVTFGPRVSCNGRIVIGDGAFIGTSAILRQGTSEKPLRTGAGAIVGMGAVVTRDVEPGAIVVGNPAIGLKKKVKILEKIVNS